MSFITTKLASDNVPANAPPRSFGFEAKDVTAITETLHGTVRIDFKGSRPSVLVDENFEELFNQIATARDKI